MTLRDAGLSWVVWPPFETDSQFEVSVVGIFCQEGSRSPNSRTVYVESRAERSMSSPNAPVKRRCWVAEESPEATQHLLLTGALGDDIDLSARDSTYTAREFGERDPS